VLDLVSLGTAISSLKTKSRLNPVVKVGENKRVGVMAGLNLHGFGLVVDHCLLKRLGNIF
jgi:hypothetical protein